MIVAAEVITGGNERGRLGPMAKAAERELENAGIEEKSEVALADAGYWNGPQIAELERAGTTVLVPPDADTRKVPSKIDGAAATSGCASDWPSPRPGRSIEDASR